MKSGLGGAPATTTTTTPALPTAALRAITNNNHPTGHSNDRENNVNVNNVMRYIITVAMLLLAAPAVAAPTHQCKPPLRIESRLDSHVNCQLARAVARDPRWSNVEPTRFKVRGQGWTCYALTDKVVGCQQNHMRSWQVRISFRVNIA